MSLRIRLILVAMATALLVAVGLSITSWMSNSEVESRLASTSLNSKKVFWSQIRDFQLEKMQASITALTRNRDALTALRKGESEALKESVVTTYRRLSAEGSEVIDKLQIADLSGSIVFSEPDGYTGRTEKYIVKQSIAEGKVFAALEMDEDGKIKAVVSTPLYYRGKKIGAGVFIRGLQAALEDIKGHDEADFTIVGADKSVQYSTNHELHSALDFDLPPLGEQAIAVVDLKQQTYTVTALPIKDATGSPAAYLVSAKDETKAYANQRNIRLMSILSVIGVLAIALGGMYWYMSRSLRPLNTAVDLMQHVAAGDLTVKIDVTSKDEIGQIMAAAKQMVEKLHNMIGQISGFTAQLASAAEEVSVITGETAKGVEQQQQDTEQMATAMNEMAATVQEVARSAVNVADASHQADKESSTGQQVVAQTIDSIHSLASAVENAADVINHLESDSESIGSILDVIRGIAEQTNLLALNAAIEAARAGEQGRGFAVVADEVRTLASRTQQSTQEIQEMIERLQTGAQNAVKVMTHGREQAQESVDQAAKANESLDAITQSVSTITDMTTQIASATEEQSKVAEEINQNVVAITDVAHRTAEGTQQTTKASEEMAGLAAKLQSMVSQFKI